MAHKHITKPIAAALLLGGVFLGPSAAQDAAPQARPSTLHVLSAADHDIFVPALALGAGGNWAGAQSLAATGQDPTAKLLVQYRYALDKTSGAGFADIDAVLKATPGWPQRGTLYARAEAAIVTSLFPSGMTPDQIIAWFGTRDPASSIGRIRLGEALIATGQTINGAALIQRGWADGTFDPTMEAAILAADGRYLTPQSDKARLDMLLWSDQLDAAHRQLTRVDAATANLAQARMALIAGLPHAKPYLAKVAGSQDPTLLFDWARALRGDHQDASAHTMLLKVAPEKLAADHTTRWWNEVNVEARDALTSGDATMAMALVDHAKLPVSDSYADQQFLGGFIALTALNDPAKALPYFKRLDSNVTRPISKSRAEYWLGRAYDAQKDPATALTHYKLAAAWPETFYGQLALARSGVASLHPNDTDVTMAPRADDALMAPIKVMADLGDDGDLLIFATAEASADAAPGQLKPFLAALTDWGYPDIALRLAKTASYAGLPMLAYTHPLLTLPPYPASGPAPDPALVLGLIRQETEFNPYAVSSAGASGLMQVMLASAKISARTASLPYRPDALLSDTAYNMQLGMVEVEQHLSDNQGSLAVALAAYNAGPSNAKKWIAANGDPRNGSVDTINWIERIPFTETRNYVQRVIENMEVYRARLAGHDVPLTILADVYGPAAVPSWASGK